MPRKPSKPTVSPSDDAPKRRAARTAAEPVADLAPAGADQPDGAAEERVRRAILEAIMSRRLAPGTRLVEIPLCQAFGVNRTLLRRVLVRLASEKVIELQHNRGALVAQPSEQETRDVFQARRLIEDAIVRALDGKVDERRLRDIRAQVAEEQAAYQKGEWARAVRLSGDFHLRLAELLGNPEMVEILRTLLARTTLMVAMYDSRSHDVCSVDEHVQILDALGNGQATQAACCMTDHLLKLEQKLKRDETPPEVDLLALFSGQEFR